MGEGGKWAEVNGQEPGEVIEGRWWGEGDDGRGRGIEVNGGAREPGERCKGRGGRGVEVNGQKKEWPETLEKDEVKEQREGSHRRSWGGRVGRSRVIKPVKEPVLTRWPHPDLLPSPGQSFSHGQ